MQIDKSQILELLHGQDKHKEADEAQAQLPNEINTDKSEHQDMLSKFGLNQDDLKGALGGLGKLR